jgi:hypothetical protein
MAWRSCVDWRELTAMRKVSAGVVVMAPRSGRVAVLAALLAAGVLLGRVEPAAAASWRPWGSLGAPPGSGTPSGPAAAARRTGELDVFVTKNSTVYHKWWSSANGWSPWGSLGSPCTGGTTSFAPAAAARAGGQLDVFLVCASGVVYHRWWSASTGWNPWGSLGAPAVRAASAPGATARATGALDVFVLGLNAVGGRQVYHRWWSASTGWNPWGPLGAPSTGLTSGPMATVRSGGQLDLFAIGGSGTIYHRWWSASTGWNPWGSLGTVPGGFAAGVGAAARRTGELDVFGLGVGASRGQVFHRWWSASTGWNPWGSLGGPTGGAAGAPAATVRAGGQLDVFTHNGSQIFHRWWG